MAVSFAMRRSEINFNIKAFDIVERQNCVIGLKNLKIYMIVRR